MGSQKVIQDSLFSVYSNLEGSEKTTIREFNYHNELVNVLLSMFEYDNIPKGLNTTFLELFAINNGKVAVGKINDKLVAVRGDLSDSLDEYGIGSKYIGATLNGKDVNWVVDTDCVILYNTELMTPDTEIPYYSSMLTETDKSIEFQILYTRLAPLLVATNDNIKNELIEKVNKIHSGNLCNVISSNVLEQIETNGQPLYKIDFTDNTKVDRLQYLTHFHDDLIRQFYMKFGQNVQGTGKMAQQSTDEINGENSLSFILPLNKLKQRQEFCKKLNEMFGTNLQVRFSEAWKIEYERFMKSAESNTVESKEESTISSAENKEEE